jgi:sugar phosphate isomerase/epimerase
MTAALVLALLPAADPADVFARDNLVAWCVVPFDGKKRNPEARAAMLAKLGFKKFAYDWRAEHLPTFEREVAALQKYRIELTAVWFPPVLNADAEKLLVVVMQYRPRPQLWVMLGQPGGKTQEEKVAAGADQVRLVAEAAAKLGCKVGLYNHGGWAGEPENQIAVIEKLGMKNVGLVYNLHHGHDHLDRFPELLAKMTPHLLCLNLNGMTAGGDKAGKKILVLGQGDRDLGLLKAIRAGGYRGPVGIIGHTQDDAEARLRDNLDGLDWLTAVLAGKDPGPRPTPRTKPGQ